MPDEDYGNSTLHGDETGRTVVSAPPHPNARSPHSTTTMRFVRLALPFVFLTAACTNPRADEGEMLARMAAEHEAELRAFQAEQADFLRRSPMPQEREFAGLGTLIIDEVALVGRPGKAWVRAHFSFVNSKSAGFDGTRVSLYVRDPASGESWSEALEMHSPIGVRPGKESTYTSSLKTPTRGVESEPGWSWELVLESRGDSAR